MRKVILSFALMLPFLMLFAGCGGEDLVAPSSTLTDAPDTLFFNNGNSDGTSTRVRFSGTASDNFSINAVQISFDNGLTWKDTTVSGTGSSMTWVYLAKESVPSAASTIRTKAQDRAGNWETAGAGTAYTKTSSSVIGSLESIVTSATADDVIYLSSGTGGAYGDSSTAIVLENSVELIIVGSGYGQAITSVNYSAVDMTPATVLESTFTSARLFSVGTGIDLRKVRIKGAVNALQISDVAASVSVSDSIFEGQKGFAIFAEDNVVPVGTSVSLTITDTMIDNFDADGNDRGGVYLDRVTYAIENSFITNQLGQPSGVEGGIYITGGSGYINSTVFVDNSTAIAVENGSPRISSCIITSPAADPSNGIRFLGVSASPIIRYNTISGNAGYGVSIEGNARPVFTNNTISTNLSGGVYIDFDFTSLSDLPVLGECSAFNICETGGRNGIFNNLPYEVIVTSTSTNYLAISAQGNFWGTGITTQNAVDQEIQDGDIIYPNHGEDDPGARAYLIYEPFDSNSNPN